MSQKPKRNVSLPQLWYKTIMQKQADQEKMRVAMTQQISEALTRLDEKYHWDEIYLFGSLAQKGKFRRNSDIDIAVLGLRGHEYYAFIGEISELLNKRVDVVLLEECHFADSIKERGIRWNRKSGL